MWVTAGFTTLLDVVCSVKVIVLVFCNFDDVRLKPGSQYDAWMTQHKDEKPCDMQGQGYHVEGAVPKDKDTCQYLKDP